MAMLRTLLVDDSPGIIRTLKKLIERYCPQIEIVATAGSADEAFELIGQMKPDLLLLDIEMPRGSGFDLLERCKPLDFEVIFVTAFDQYALKAIKFCALDYLLKPVDPAELKEAVRRAEERVSNRVQTQHFEFLLENLRVQDTKSHKLAIPTVEGLQFISVNRIVRCEAEGNYSMIKLNDNSLLVSTQRLKELESLLSDRDFCRVHRSHLVNLEYVKKYFRSGGGYILMADGAHIDLSRQKREDFLRRFGVS